MLLAASRSFTMIAEMKKQIKGLMGQIDDTNQAVATRDDYKVM